MNPELGFSDRILNYRKSHGESQTAFGSRFGVSRLTVSNWEMGSEPHRKRYSEVIRFLEDAAKEDPKASGYQLLLPFDPPFEIELKISPQMANVIRIEVHLKRQVS